MTAWKKIPSRAILWPNTLENPSSTTPKLEMCYHRITMESIIFLTLTGHISTHGSGYRWGILTKISFISASIQAQNRMNQVLISQVLSMNFPRIHHGYLPCTTLWDLDTST